MSIPSVRDRSRPAALALLVPACLAVAALLAVAVLAGCAAHRGPLEDVAAGRPGLPGGPAGGLAGGPDSLECYLVQLHLHGHSNHNGNALPASIESHTAEAAGNGFDVIWWTDHAELFTVLEDVTIGFAEARLAASGDTVMLSPRQGRRVSKIVVERSAGALEEAGPGGADSHGSSNVRVEGGRLAARVGAGPEQDEYLRLALVPASRLGTVRDIGFCRPVASGLVVDAWFEAEGLGRDAYVRFDFDLSWHPRGRHRVSFEAVAAGPAPPARLDDSTVVGQFVLPAGAGRVSLDLEAAAGLLPYGQDNTLSSMRLEIGARRGGALTVALDSLVVRSTRPGGANQFATVDSLAAACAGREGVTSQVGVEVGKIHLPTLPHMNAYLPARPAGPGDFALDRTSPRGEWVAEVHRRGGLVSFNHPFGASRNARGRGNPEYGGEDADEDAPTAQPPRVLQAAGAGATDEEFWEVAGPLLDLRALGADLLEVGYLFRGVGSLGDHLRLWDLALANGIRLVGEGAADSHGGAWGPDMIPNPFASWVWAAGPSAGDIIEGMRRGRVVFGDPFAWKSDVVFLASAASGGAGGRRAGAGDDAADAPAVAVMGDTLFVPAGSRVDTWAEMAPPRDDVEVTQVLVSIKPGREVETVRSIAPAGQAHRFVTQVSDSCCVRLEIWSRDGQPLAFTNPIYLFPAR